MLYVPKRWNRPGPRRRRHRRPLVPERHETGVTGSDGAERSSVCAWDGIARVYLTRRHDPELRWLWTTNEEPA